MEPPSLFLELLGVPAAIACDDAELLRRLRVAYGRSLAAEPGERALAASLRRAEGGWILAVEGREARRERDATSALRGFHHELLHGVMLRRLELYYVHAAVVAIGARAVVLPGLSGAGKSTLALALVARGARFLSDELLAFDPESGHALAFPRAPKIRDACVGYFPRYARHWVGTGEARSLPFEALPADAVADRARPAAVVAPRWSPPGEELAEAADACVPIGAGEALLALASSSLNFGAHRSASLDSLTRLVAGAACARLAWRDPRAAAEAIEALVGAAPGGGP